MTATEAWIEDVRAEGCRVMVDLLLADGTRANVPLDRARAEWLELSPGQIVGVRRRLAGHPGLALLG